LYSKLETMAVIYSAPTEIETPKLDFRNVQGYRTACDAYLVNLKKFVLDASGAKEDDPIIGQTVKYPMADSHAMYMVAATKPLALVHIPLWDAWDYPGISKVRLPEIKTKIANQKAIDEMFAKKK